MATKDNDVDAPVAVTPKAEPVETRAQPRRALLVGGMIAAGALAGALLFGGGVLVGANLHGHDQRPEIAEMQLPFGALPPGAAQGGPRDQQGPRDQGGAPGEQGGQRGPQQGAPGGQDAPDLQGDQPPAEQDAN